MSDSYLTGGNKSFYIHFTFEHEGLDCAVHDLQSALRDSELELTAGQLKQRLTQLRHLMTKHFEEEEEGCFDEICAQHPHLCADTRGMEGTHRQLLKAFDKLVKTLDTNQVSENWKKQFDKFAADMKAHEEEEQAFVRRGLQIGDEDS